MVNGMDTKSMIMSFIIFFTLFVSSYALYNIFCAKAE